MKHALKQPVNRNRQISRFPEGNCSQEGRPELIKTGLPQGELPKQTGIWQAAAPYGQACAGTYTSVLQGGKSLSHDPVCIESV